MLCFLLKEEFYRQFKKYNNYIPSSNRWKTCALSSWNHSRCLIHPWIPMHFCLCGCLYQDAGENAHTVSIHISTKHYLNWSMTCSELNIQTRLKLYEHRSNRTIFTHSFVYGKSRHRIWIPKSFKDFFLLVLWKGTVNHAASLEITGGRTVLLSVQRL